VQGGRLTVVDSISICFESWLPVARTIVSALIMFIRLYQLFTPL
jgi:hypothetical protein